MPGFPVPFIKFREDDNNGDPLAGGWLYSYAAGTSTPLATYSSQTLAIGTENTNPTLLDASGRANIWIEDGVGYKFVLKDALFNTIWTQDNVQVPAIEPPPSAENVPAGAILAYIGTVAPTGYLLCDGAAVSRTTYRRLFDVIGETFGGGNGATTFSVPNLVGRFPLGKAASGTGSVLADTGGDINHVHAGPSHKHTVLAHSHTLAHTHTLPRDGWGTINNAIAISGRLRTGDPGSGGSEITPSQATADNTTSDISAVNTGDQTLTTEFGGTENTAPANPPFLVVNYIVKT